MKRLIALLLLAAVLLSACSDNAIREPYTEEINGVAYHVDPVKRVVTANGYEFTYTLSDEQTSVEYPNGAVFSENRHGYGDSASTLISQGWINADADLISADGGDYANCYDLISVIPEPEEAIPEDPYAFKFDLVLFIMGAVALPVGIYAVRRPEEVWYFRFWWHFKSAEPSDYSLGMIKFSGIAGIVAGAICIIAAFF